MKFVLAYADKHWIKVDKSKFWYNCTVIISGDSIYFNQDTKAHWIFVSKLNQYDISEYLPELYGDDTVQSSRKKKLPEAFRLSNKDGIPFMRIKDENIHNLWLEVLESIHRFWTGTDRSYNLNSEFHYLESENSDSPIVYLEELHEYELPMHIEAIVNRYRIWNDPKRIDVVCDVTNLEWKDVSEYVVLHSISDKNLLTSPMWQDFFDFIDWINLGIRRFDRNCVLRKTDEWFSYVCSSVSEYSKLVTYTDTKNMSNVYTPEEFMEEFWKEYLERKKISNKEYLERVRSNHQSFVTAEEMKQHEANNYSSTSSSTKTMSTFASEKIKKFFANTNAVTVISDAKEELDNAISSLYFASKECDRVRNGVITLREALNDAISRDDVDGIEEALDKIRKSAEYVDNFGKNKIEDFTAPKKEFDVQEFFK